FLVLTFSFTVLLEPAATVIFLQATFLTFFFGTLAQTETPLAAAVPPLVTLTLRVTALPAFTFLVFGVTLTAVSFGVGAGLTLVGSEEIAWATAPPPCTEAVLVAPGTASSPTLTLRSITEALPPAATAASEVQLTFWPLAEQVQPL